MAFLGSIFFANMGGGGVQNFFHICFGQLQSCSCNLPLLCGGLAAQSLYNFGFLWRAQPQTKETSITMRDP